MKKLIILLPLLFLFVLSCDHLTPTENHDPNPLVSPESINITSGDATQTVRLVCSENPDGAYLYDEDGDTVTVVVDPETPLPDSISLNEETGVLTIIRTSNISGTLRFWTVDNQGGSSEDQALTLSYSITASGNSAPYPVSYLSSIVSYGVDYAQASGVQSIQLDIQDVGGLDDPDGDNVYFRSTTNFDAVDWITFTENGLIQIDTTGSHSAETFEFYSEDDYGERQTQANFQLTISVSFS